jgi:hypothetical protein
MPLINVLTPIIKAQNNDNKNSYENLWLIQFLRKAPSHDSRLAMSREKTSQKRPQVHNIQPLKWTLKPVHFIMLLTWGHIYTSFQLHIYRVIRLGMDLVRRPLTGLLYQPRMMMMNVKQSVEWDLAAETEVLNATLSTTNPTWATLGSNPAAAVGCWRLTAWAMARPEYRHK